MAQYWLQIASADDLDAFTKVLGNGTVSYEVDSGMPSIKVVLGSDNRNFLKWNAVPSVADVKIAIYGRRQVNNTNRQLGAAARVTMTSQTVNSYYMSAAYGSFGTGVLLLVSPIGSSGFTTLDDSDLQINNATAPHWNVLECNGSTIRSRCFDAAITGLGDQPAEWSSSVTDTQVTGAADTGVIVWRDATGNAAWLYAIAAATEGDPLPTGPVGGARRRSSLILTPW